MRQGQRVFVDSGAWIALALTRDPLHDRAVAGWHAVREAGSRLFTSVPVVLETFTFLDRSATREAAIAWKDGLKDVDRLEVIECRIADVDAAWSWFDRPDLFRLSAVDATSFTLMKRHRIRIAFAFDHHFGTVGFRMVG